MKVPIEGLQRKLNGYLRRRKVTDLPGVTAVARIDRRTKGLTKRLRSGEVAIIDHVDVDRVSAEALVACGVAGVVNVAAGDLGASATKKYDIEAWFPSQGRYREITSTSNTTDFQARRLDVRYRTERGVETLHTLNGTAATARHMLAILENFQDEGGGVAIPAALVPFGAPARLERTG